MDWQNPQPSHFYGMRSMPVSGSTMDIVSPLPEAMRFALNFSSADRLLFSSDHPWVQPAQILNPFRSLQLDSADEAKILTENARHMFLLPI